MIISVIVFFNIQSVLKEINQVQDEKYTFEENTIVVNGNEIIFVFSKTAVQIKESYRIKKRKDRLTVLKILKNELQERGLSNRSITSMEGEWVLHNIAYCLRERLHSTDLDLDYDRDPRGYVAILSTILGNIGL